MRGYVVMQTFKMHPGLVPIHWQLIIYPCPNLSKQLVHPAEQMEPKYPSPKTKLPKNKR